MGKPWVTKEWRNKRAEFIKEKSCEWCGSSKFLTISHKQQTNFKSERYKVFGNFFDKYFKPITTSINSLPGQHIDEYNNLIEESKVEENLRYVDCCPSCGSLSIYARSDKFLAKNTSFNSATGLPEFKCKFRCSLCKMEFQEPKKGVHPKFYERRKFFQLFGERHKEEIGQLLEEHLRKLNEKYLNFEGVQVLCRRCHFAYHNGLVLCQNCKKKYHGIRFNTCYNCLPPERKKHIQSLKDEEKKFQSWVETFEPEEEPEEGEGEEGNGEDQEETAFSSLDPSKEIT